MEENTRRFQEPTLAVCSNISSSLICTKNVFLGSCEDMKKVPLNRTFWFIYIMRYILTHHVVGFLCRSTCLWWESSPSEYKNGEREGGEEYALGRRSCCTDHSALQIWRWVRRPGKSWLWCSRENRENRWVKGSSVQGWTWSSFILLSLCRMTDS